LIWFLRSPSPGRLLASAFALALCAYGGDPQALGIAVLAGGAWALLEPPRLRRAVLGLSWVVCALLLCAPVVLPAISQLQRSERRAGVSDVERRMFYAPPKRLLGLAVPIAFDGTETRRGKEADPYSEFIAGRPAAPFLGSICLGAPALLFAAASVRRKRAGFLLVTGALLVVASTGPAGHLQPLLEAVIPGWRLFRFPEKFLIHASWILAATAGLGADEALLGGRDRTRSLAWLGAALATAAAGVFLACTAATEPLVERLSRAGYTHDPENAARFLESLRIGSARTAVLAAAVAGIAVLRLRRERAQMPVLLACGAAAVSALIAPPLRTVRAELYEAPSATARKLVEMAGPSEGRWRVWSNADRNLPLPDEEGGLNDDEQRLLGLREGLWPQVQAIDGIEGAAVYSSAIDTRYRAVLRGAPEAALDLLDVRFQVVLPAEAASTGAVRSESGFGILERPGTVRAFVVHRTRRASDVDAAVSDLRSIKIREEAVVPLEGPVLAGGPLGGPASVRRPRPDRIEASVDAAAPGLLVVSEHYDPGWRAEVDGKEAAVHEANFIVLGIPVPIGRHEVRLRYVPVGFVPGVALAGVTVLVLCALAFRHSPRPNSRIL
jgi:hypothetical protein